MYNYFERSERRHDRENAVLLEVHEYYEYRDSYDFAGLGEGVRCVYEAYAEYMEVREY